MKSMTLLLTATVSLLFAQGDTASVATTSTQAAADSTIAIVDSTTQTSDTTTADASAVIDSSTTVRVVDTATADTSVSRDSVTQQAVVPVASVAVVAEESAKEEVPAVEASVKEEAEVAETSPAKEEPKKEKKKKEIKPIFTGGLQFYNSRYGTSSMALNLELGLRINRRHQHSIDGYKGISDWGSDSYSVDNVWGVNYNYLFLLNLGKKIRIDLGAKAGYNIYEESSELNDYKTVTFGGPKGQLNISLKRFGLGGGYTMYAGYREFNNEKTSTRIDQFNVTLGVKF